jgi:hypothetical protein
MSDGILVSRYTDKRVSGWVLVREILVSLDERGAKRIAYSFWFGPGFGTGRCFGPLGDRVAVFPTATEARYAAEAAKVPAPTQIRPVRVREARELVKPTPPREWPRVEFPCPECGDPIVTHPSTLADRLYGKLPHPLSEEARTTRVPHPASLPWTGRIVHVCGKCRRTWHIALTVSNGPELAREGSSDAEHA